MMLAALALILLGSPASFAPEALRRASPELASVVGERRREGLRYERIPGSFEGLRFERAADLVIRGTVVDQTGLPVPRALVYIDGTQASTETDDAGRFSLALTPVK